MAQLDFKQFSGMINLISGILIRNKIQFISFRVFGPSGGKQFQIPSGNKYSFTKLMIFAVSG